MARAQHPSDEKRRKTKPAARVHTSIRNHPRFAHVFADRELRGIIVGLWVVGVDKYAGRTCDTITLTLPDVMWVAGTSAVGPGVSLLKGACKAMGYPVVRSEDEWGIRYRIGIRNLSKKQGLAPRGANTETPTPHASESESESESKEESKKKVMGAKALIVWLHQDFLPNYPEHRRVQIPTAEAELRKLYASGYLRTDEDRREVVDRLKRWVAGHDWTKDGGEWVPGVGKFFRDALWKREPGSANGHGKDPPKNPNVLSTLYCGCQDVKTPEGRKTIPCGKHTERAVEIRREVNHGG